MTAIAEILSPGLFTSVQDSGRAGLRHLGVPQSGAADRLSLACANAALGNPLGASALEATLTGPTLKFECDVSFCIAGADMSAALNDKTIPLYQPIEAGKGNILTLSAAKIGARSYIAFRGGVAGENFLGSFSTYSPAALGGIEGRALKKGDHLAGAGLKALSAQAIPRSLRPQFTHDFILRASLGPDAAMIKPANLEKFFASAWSVDRRAGRMGARLTGADIALADAHPMNSSAVFPGTVQCPPDGAPFLLLADAQTLGGYPRIAQLIAADLPLAGQIRPGDRVWFRKVSAEAACDITLQKQALIGASLPAFSFY